MKKRDLEKVFLKRREEFLRDFEQELNDDYKAFSLPKLLDLKYRLDECLFGLGEVNGIYINALSKIEEDEPTSREEKERFRVKLCEGILAVQKRWREVVYFILDKEDKVGEK